jgi:hypothetical protein
MNLKRGIGTLEFIEVMTQSRYGLLNLGLTVVVGQDQRGIIRNVKVGIAVDLRSKRSWR